MQKLFRLLFLLAALTVGQGTRGCDLCGCYTPSSASTQPSATGREPTGHWFDRAYFAIAEQFTYFNTLQLDGREVANPTDQFMASSITQLVLGYQITPRFALQLNLPLIYRSFERPEGFEIDHGTEAGLGDITLLGTFVLFRKESGGRRAVDFHDPKNPRMDVREPDFTVSGSLLGGVKFPSGNTDRLKEEFDEVEIPGAPESGIHGHDLTLGTGSFDGIFGGQISLRYLRFFFEADTQFIWRGEGDHQYHFANDITWSGGPGYYAVRNERALIGVQLAVSGEHKGMDRFRGQPAADTGITSIYLGPRLIAAVGKLSGEIAAELPVSIHNTALQVVPDYRLRGSVTVHF
jgi:hypothetical protein